MYDKSKNVRHGVRDGGESKRGCLVWRQWQQGSPGVKLEVTEIKMSRSSFRVTIGSGAEKKIKGEIYGRL